MRRLAIFGVLVGLVFALGACDKKKKNKKSDNGEPVEEELPLACEEIEEGNLRCNDILVEQCQVGAWEEVASCAPSTCVMDGDLPACVDGLSPTCEVAADGSFRCNASEIQHCQSPLWVTVQDCDPGTCELVAGTALCGGDLPPTCSLEQDGEYRCKGASAQQCQTTVWVTLDNCAPDVCQILFDVAQCVALVGESCLPTELAAERCEGTMLQYCNGAEWLAITDCSETSEVCREVAPEDWACAPPPIEVGKKEACDGYGTVCEAPWDCTKTFQGTMCLAECGSDPDVCDDVIEYCEDGSPAMDGPHCWATSGRDYVCIPEASAAACRIADTSCTFVANGVAWECKDTCDAADLGSNAGCIDDTDLCLESVGIEPDPDETACTTLGSADECPDTYTCMPLIDSLTCARHIPLCGQAASIEGNFVDPDGLGPQAPLKHVVDALIAGSIPPTICGFPGLNRYCQPAPGFEGLEGLEVRCEAFGSALVFPDASFPSGHVECGVDENDVPIQADCYDRQAQCIHTPLGTLCAWLPRVCVQYCEDSEGNAYGASYETTCADGKVCGIPDAKMSYVLQGGTLDPVLCETEGTDEACTGEFSCVNFGAGALACARRRRVCMDP